MTSDEFLEAAKAGRINPNAFSLTGDGTECYVLKQQQGWFEVFYAERGLETSLHYFPDQSSALEYLLCQLLDDPTASSREHAQE